MGRLPSESAALKLVYAVASTYARSWRGLTVTAQQWTQIDRLMPAGKEPRSQDELVTVG